MPHVYYRRHSKCGRTFLSVFWGRWWRKADLNTVSGLRMDSGHSCPLISKRMWLRVYRSDNLEMFLMVTYPVSQLTFLTNVHIYCSCKLGIQNCYLKTQLSMTLIWCWWLLLFYCRAVCICISVSAWIHLFRLSTTDIDSTNIFRRFPLMDVATTCKSINSPSKLFTVTIRVTTAVCILNCWLIIMCSFFFHRFLCALPSVFHCANEINFCGWKSIITASVRLRYDFHKNNKSFIFFRDKNTLCMLASCAQLP